MKRTQFIIFFFMSVLTYGQAQVIIIPDSYTQSWEFPRLALRSDTLVMETDSVYLVTPARLRFYESFRLAFRTGAISDCSDIVGFYEAAVLDNHKNTQRFLSENNRLFISVDNYLLRNTESWNSVKIQISAIQQDLRTAQALQKSLQEINQKERRLRFFKGVGLSAASIGVGILIGAFIIK